jgi:hypothetical protein
MNPRLAAALLLLTALAAQRPPARTTAPWIELQVDGAIPWLRDPEVYIDGRSTKWSADDKVDRQALLAQALQQATEQHQPVLWYVYRIVDRNKHGVQMYRAPVLDMYMQQVLFADPDVARIVKTRFVPLRMVCDEAMCERFGLRPLQYVEPMVVFLDAGGKKLHVVERLRTFDALWFADLLRRVLDHAGAPAPECKTASEAIDAGMWEKALALLGDEPTDAVEKAGLLRRLRRPAEALAVLDRFQRPSKKLQAMLDAERGLVLTLQGDTAGALRALEAAYRAGGDGAAEAGYWLAHNRWRDGNELGAIQQYQIVADRWPESSHGKRARLNLMLGDDERPVGATFCGFENAGYLPDAAYAGLPRDTTWAGPARDPKQTAESGVRFLLRMQREHGGFTDSRYAYWPTPELTPNAWVAITALAATALLEWRDVDPAHVDAALQRAEGYLFDERRLRRGQNEDVYADAYRLLYLARKAGGLDGGTKLALIARMNQLIEEARARQAEPGFWAHEYQNAFCTGVMLWSALLCKREGATVPDDMLDRAATALLSARFKNGAFSYGGAAPAKGEGSLKDASGRMPLCEAALLAHARSEPERLEFAFDNFWQHLARIETVRRNDFHSDGELAGFFFFHALFHTSEAMKMLPEARRTAAKAKLQALLQRIAEIDGSFVDSHEIGRSYGTAMALLTLRNVAG